MKTILIIFSLFILVNLSAQEDTLSNDKFVMPSYEIENFFAPEFLNALPKKESIIEYKKQDNYKQYFFLFCLNLLVVTTLLLSISKQKVKDLMKTFTSINLLKQLTLVESKKNNTYIYAYFILFILFFLTYVNTLAKINDIEIDLSKFSVAILLFFFLNLLINFTTKYLLQIKEVFNTLNANDLTYMLLTIPFLICALFLIVFLPKSIAINVGILSIFLIVVIYFFKEIRNVLILNSFKIKIGSFYFFLYLCTFKILPILVLVKYLGTNS